MRSKISKEVDVRLPKGLVNILANFPKPVEEKLNNESLAPDEQGMPKKKADKIWYVMLEKHEPIPDAPVFGVTSKRVVKWDWAFTRQHVRDLARAAQKDGWKVVDICKGTKAHVGHKYQGL